MNKAEIRRSKRVIYADAPKKEYIERGALQEALQRKKAGPANIRYTEGWNDCLMRVKSMVSTAKAADVVELPCKVRDKVWLNQWWDKYEWKKLSSPIERRVIYFSIEVDGMYAHLKDGCINVKYFGEVVFLTREEAERALSGAKMDGGKDNG